MFNWAEYFSITSTFISTSLSPTHHTSRGWLDNRALEAYFQIYLSHTLSVWSAFMLHCWLRADKYLERIFFFYWQTCSVNCTSLVLCLEREWLGDVRIRAGGNCFRRCKCGVQCTHTTEIGALVDSPRVREWVDNLGPAIHSFLLGPVPCVLYNVNTSNLDFSNLKLKSWLKLMGLMKLFKVVSIKLT